MKTPRVREVLSAYAEGNIVKVYQYLTQPDMEVDPSTWAGNIKKRIENREYETTKQIIELIAYKLTKI